MKNATAISHGSSRLLALASGGCDGAPSFVSGGVTFVALGSIGLRDRLPQPATPETQLSPTQATISSSHLRNCINPIRLDMALRNGELKKSIEPS
jgi:hypothetical protein